MERSSRGPMVALSTPSTSSRTACRQRTPATIVADGAGGAVVAWQDSIHLVAQHVLASGTFDPLYPDTGRALCTLSSEQVDPALVATGGAGAIAAWMDSRNVSSP